MQISIGIYPRKLIFFAVCGLLLWGGANLYKYIVKQVAAARVYASPVESLNTSSVIGKYFLEIDLRKDGSMMAGGRRISGIQPGKDYDELRQVVLDQPRQFYSDVEVVVNLPQKTIALLRDPKIIAVHGARPWGAYLKDDKIVYRAMDVTQGATVTITSAFPKGYFDFPPAKRAVSAVEGIPGTTWLAAAYFIPPAIPLIIFLIFTRRRIVPKNVRVKGEKNLPPDRSSPAVVNVLIEGATGTRTIIATLVDLAQRGYLEIYNRSKDFVIYRKSTTAAQNAMLKSFEVILLEKIFLSKQKAVGSMDVEARAARHLFSRKIALFNLAVYREAQSYGFFDALPAKIHLRFRLLGIATFFAGLIGYILSAFLAPDPKFVLILWASLILMGIIIVNLSPRLTSYAKRGIAQREKWLEFKNFLSRREPFAGKPGSFESYLPYAIALGCEADWAARFALSNFVKPSWYDYPDKIEGVENFAKSFLPITEFVGKTLNFVNEPLVK